MSDARALRRSARAPVPAHGGASAPICPTKCSPSRFASLGQDYATAQDAALLREVYPTLKSDRTREAVFSALAEMGGSENMKWMLALAQNGNEPIHDAPPSRSTPRAAPARRSPI